MRTTDSIVRELAVFALITFAITWTMAGLILAGGPEMPLVLPLIYGPSISAIITTALFRGTEGLGGFFRRYVQIRAPWYVYAIVTVGFLLVGFAGVVLWRALGNEWNRAVPPLAALAQVTLFQVLVPGLGEEPGWRGFALPRLLQKMGPLPASLVMGAVHWLWHLPTFFMGTGMHNVPAVWSLLYIIAFTIVFTWVMQRSQHSIFVAILFHGLHGAMLSAANFLPSESDVPIAPELLWAVGLPDGLLGPYAIVLALFWCAAFAIILADWNRRPTARPNVIA